MDSFVDAVVLGRVVTGTVGDYPRADGQQERWAVYEIEVVEAIKGSTGQSVTVYGKFNCLEPESEHYLLLEDRTGVEDAPGEYVVSSRAVFRVRVVEGRIADTHPDNDQYKGINSSDFRDLLLAEFVEPETPQTHTGHDPLAHLSGYGYGADPSNVQGIVNRVHAIVVARIISFGGSRSEGPYVNGVLTDPPTPDPGRPSAAIAAGYFSFEIEKVLLDDGYVTSATRFRGAPEEDHRFNPDVGERYILCLFRNSDNRSYGASSTFGLIELVDGMATRQDGSPLRIEAPTDEDSLIKAFEDAISVRRAISLNEWNEPYADLPGTGGE